MSKSNYKILQHLYFTNSLDIVLNYYTQTAFVYAVLEIPTDDLNILSNIPLKMISIILDDNILLFLEINHNECNANVSKIAEDVLSNKISIIRMTLTMLDIDYRLKTCITASWWAIPDNKSTFSENAVRNSRYIPKYSADDVLGKYDSEDLQYQPIRVCDSVQYLTKRGLYEFGITKDVVEYFDAAGCTHYIIPNNTYKKAVSIVIDITNHIDNFSFSEEVERYNKALEHNVKLAYPNEQIHLENLGYIKADEAIIRQYAESQECKSTFDLFKYISSKNQLYLYQVSELTLKTRNNNPIWIPLDENKLIVIPEKHMVAVINFKVYDPKLGYYGYPLHNFLKEIASKNTIDGVKAEIKDFIIICNMSDYMYETFSNEYIINLIK